MTPWVSNNDMNMTVMKYGFVSGLKQKWVSARVRQNPGDELKVRYRCVYRLFWAAIVTRASLTNSAALSAALCQLAAYDLDAGKWTSEHACTAANWLKILFTYILISPALCLPTGSAAPCGLICTSSMHRQQRWGCDAFFAFSSSDFETLWQIL